MKKTTSVNFFIVLGILLSSQSGHTQGYQYKENNEASKAIALIERVKNHLSSEDRSEYQILEMIQRNLTKRHVVLNLYTSGVQSEVEKYLGSKVFKKHDASKPVKVLIRQKKKDATSPPEKRGGTEKLNELRNKIFKKGKENE